MIPKTIDMQLMRYINLFERICRVSTTDCFVYNNVIIFAVPKSKVSLAIGKNGANMRKIGEVLRKRIKVIEMPQEGVGVKKFVEAVVDPITFNKFEISNGMATISAGRQSKAALIGRGRSRQKELEDILIKAFNIRKLRIS
jgi:NusA-like KH domain protein